MSLISYIMVSYRPSIILLGTLFILAFSPRTSAVFSIDGNIGKLETRIRQQDLRIVLLENNDREKTAEIEKLKEQNKDLTERLSMLEDRLNQLPATNKDMLDRILENKLTTVLHQIETRKSIIDQNNRGLINDLKSIEMNTEIQPSLISGIHFFVQRKTPLNIGGVVSFEIEKLNVGGAMEFSTGIFTTPKTGIYHFAFSGIRDKGPEDTYVELYRTVGSQTDKIVVAYADHSATYGALGFTATIRLLKGDIINVVLKDGGLYDSLVCSYTSFTGSLLMEEK